MKHLLTIFLMTLMTFTVVNCSSSKENKSEGEKMADDQTLQNVERPQYVISVKHGDKDLGKITLETFPDIAPKHAHNFDSLVTVGFYNGTAFHRVIPGFMIQGGDPNSKDQPKEKWGFGAPGQTRVPAEFSDTPHERGILSAARSQDPNSATSQFFIMVEYNSHLDGKYSVFGKVLDGMDVVDEIVSVPRDSRDNPDQKVEMTIEKKK
jgi:peptidyl-prolyl cis-trans isomerase B (cyclophilin B)